MHSSFMLRQTVLTCFCEFLYHAIVCYELTLGLNYAIGTDKFSCASCGICWPLTICAYFKTKEELIGQNGVQILNAVENHCFLHALIFTAYPTSDPAILLCRYQNGGWCVDHWPISPKIWEQKTVPCSTAKLYANAIVFAPCERILRCRGPVQPSTRKVYFIDGVISAGKKPEHFLLA